MIERSCCFTGHRLIPKKEREKIEAVTEQIIINLYKQGIEYFYCGCALGYDTLCAKIVLKLSKLYPIKLITVIPCLNQSEKWKPNQIETYNEINERAYYSVYTGIEYTPDCMLRRNRYMVDRSCVCVAYLKRPSGGTKYTVNYANQRGVSVLNIADYGV